MAGQGESVGPPRLPGRLVPRPRQLRRLDRLSPVTIIETLPGFGKTTLAASWAHQLDAAGTRVLWVDATADHYDASFADSDLADSDGPVLVVIDDAHLVPDVAVADALMQLVRRAHQVHVLACADADHHFHEAAARHKLETNVLRATDLGIVADEVPEFAEAWGYDLDPDSAQLLHGLLGGWLLPLRLVLDGTPSWSGEFATHVAHQFFTDTVIPDITAADLSAAQRLAVPEYLDGDLATVLLDDADDSVGEQAITKLEHQGLVWRVPRHDGGAQWRYPKLVRRALLEQLERSDPETARSAHCDVARALATVPGADRSSALLRHARSGDDWRLLTRLWADRGWSMAGGDAEAFEFAYAAIPETVRQEHPSLRLAACLGDALATTSDAVDWIHRIETLLRHFMQAGSDFLQGQHQIKSPTQRVELLTAGMIARRSSGNVAEARRLAAEAARELGRARIVEPDQIRTSQVAWFQVQNAVTQLLSGNYTSAHELATASYQAGPNTLVGAGAAGLLSMIHAIAGQTGDARSWLAAHEAVDLSGHWVAPLAELPARIARTMLALDRLDGKQAEAELTGVPLGPEASGLWPLIFIAHSRYALIFGDPVAALSRLQHISGVMARHVRDDASVARLIVDRCSVDQLLAMGEVSRVQSKLQEEGGVPSSLLAPAARFHLMIGNSRAAARISSAGVWRDDISARDRLELLVISALAFRDQGKPTRALEGFRMAHALSADTGNLQPLLMLPADVRREFLDASGLSLEPDVVSALNAVGPIYPMDVEIVQLSPRELEVLRQIHHHATAASLARSLSVSVNTVKKQMASLYTKLGVNDRSAALLRAQGLGLIDAPSDAEVGGDGAAHGVSPVPNDQGR